MGLRFAATIFKAGKLDLREIVGLIVVALKFSSGLRYVEHHHFSCAYYSRRRCVSMFGFGHDFFRDDGLELVATSYNTTKV
jgi:hypothetical protein